MGPDLGRRHSTSRTDDGSGRLSTIAQVRENKGIDGLTDGHGQSSELLWSEFNLTCPTAQQTQQLLRWLRALLVNDHGGVANARLPPIPPGSAWPCRHLRAKVPI